MKEQTKDNLRCLAAALFAIASMFALFIARDAWFPSLPNWALIVLIFFLLGLTGHLFNMRFGRAAQTERVCFDEQRITRTLPDGKIETVEWNDLQEIGILTTDEGP